MQTFYPVVVVVVGGVIHYLDLFHRINAHL